MTPDPAAPGGHVRKFAWLSVAGLLLTGLALAAFLWPGLSLASMNNTVVQERTMLPTQPGKLTPGGNIPPLDTAVPAQTETATFALG
jgi:hypothetical protein